MGFYDDQLKDSDRVERRIMDDYFPSNTVMWVSLVVIAVVILLFKS
jgi:hypothetical protein